MFQKKPNRFNSGTTLPPFILPPSVLNASIPDNDMPQYMQTSVTEIKIEKDDIINNENQNVLSNQTDEINTVAHKLREKQKRIIIDDDIDAFFESLETETITGDNNKMTSIDIEGTETSDSDDEYKSEFELYIGEKKEVPFDSFAREDKVMLREKLAIGLPSTCSAIKRLGVSRYYMRENKLYVDQFQSIEDAAIYAYMETENTSLAGKFTIYTIYKICTLEIEPFNEWIYRFTSHDAINISDSLPGFKRYYKYYLPLRAKLRREGYIVPLPGTIDTDPYINKRILHTHDDCIGVVIGYLLPETREKDGQGVATGQDVGDGQGVWYRVYYLDDDQSEDLEAHELDPLMERYEALDPGRVSHNLTIFFYCICMLLTHTYMRIQKDNTNKIARTATSLSLKSPKIVKKKHTHATHTDHTTAPTKAALPSAGAEASNESSKASIKPPKSGFIVRHPVSGILSLLINSIK